MLEVFGKKKDQTIPSFTQFLYRFAFKALTKHFSYTLRLRAAVFSLGGVRRRKKHKDSRINEE